jgi:hypothetical protein
MYITLCRHSSNRRATSCSSKDCECSWHTFCIVYLSSYWMKHTGRWQCFVHYCTNTSMSKPGPYTTVHKDGHNNWSANKWNYDMQTCNLGRPSAHYKSGQFSIVWQFTI